MSRSRISPPLLFTSIYLISSLFLFETTWSFLQPSSSSSSSLSFTAGNLLQKEEQFIQNTDLKASEETTSNESSSKNTLEIILFGTGDLRTIDHGGLNNALLSASSSSTVQLLPLFILETKDTLPNMPMGTTHTIDNAFILHQSLVSLQNKLKSNYNLDLHVCNSNDKDRDDGIVSCLKKVIQSAVLVKDGESKTLDEVIVHTCDLGDADNEIGYGPYQHLKNVQDLIVDNDGDDIQVKIQSWDCFLREEPWKNLSNESTLQQFPDNFAEYEEQYGLKKKHDDGDMNAVTKPQTVELKQCKDIQGLTIPSLSAVPSMSEISDMICAANGIDAIHEAKKLETQTNTGLYATHWGGLDKSTMNEDTILNAINIFLGNGDENLTKLDGDKALVDALKWWSKGNSKCKLTRNPKSLEHASMNWIMTGGSDGDIGLSLRSSNDVKTKSLIEGELLMRYLAAPLVFGNISPRCLVQKAEEVSLKKFGLADVFAPNLPSVIKKRNAIKFVKSIAENREWHTLFAAKNLRNQKKLDSNSLSYEYFRWHGFLCRYGIRKLQSESNQQKDEKEGIVLLHGFGASGSQWTKAITELKTCIRTEREVDAFAPDLIGFGQSEKPPLTYSQYLWEGYTADCVKEFGLGKNKWAKFIIGGNSIGGYTAMGVAADDTPLLVEKDCVTSMGSVGSGRCSGLVLINSAGKLLSKEEINSSDYTTSVAVETASDLLGLSSPPPREIAFYGGTGLLWYLRPQIKSICKNLYPTNPDAVDDVLCDGILRDSLDPGAINVMISGSKLPPPRTANELLGAAFGSSRSSIGSEKSSKLISEGTFDGPVLISQGILDPLNDARQRADLFSQLRTGITVDRINGGHCPHDELPKEIADSLLGWMQNSVWNQEVPVATVEAA